MRYAAFFIFGFATFIVLFRICEYLFNNVFIMSRYLDRTKQERLVFSETIAANFIHAIMQPWSMYLLLYPHCDGYEYNGPFAPLMDDTCFN